MIRHSFFKKEVASNKVIMYRSAVSIRTKRDTLFQEGLRRLRHMDDSCTVEEVNHVMAEFCYNMMVSGYSVGTRMDIVNGVMERKDKVEEEIRAGTRIRFRNMSEIDQMREKDLNKHRNTWYLIGGATGVLFVPATPDSELCKMVRQGIGKLKCPDGGLTKVVEAGGASILAGLAKADPFRVLRCPFEEVCWF